jgi:anti-sigma factor RsiW
MDIMDIMAHLSPQVQHRFLARLLSPEETLEVIKHLRECDACREKLSALRSNKPSSVADAILPETPIEEHPSADSLGAYLDDDLGHPDKVDLEEHLRTCQLCQEALADLKSFRLELLQSPPQEYAPVAETSRSFSSHWFSEEKQRFLDWFNQPLVYAGAAAVAALIVVFGVVVARSPETFGIGGNGRVTVADGGHRIVVGPNGITNPPTGLPGEALTALNNVAAPILNDEPPSLSPTLKDNLALLKRAPSTLLGESSGTVPFQVLSPVRTLVESVQPIFKWTAATSASGYIVHVIADDRTQEEVATSPVIIPTADATTCQWVLAESMALSPGKRYRWYVTATIKDQEVDAPGMEEAQAKFAILSVEDLTNLNVLRKSAQSDRLIDGLLNLNAGLLDTAQSDFEYLLANPGQTSAAKDFLNRMIEEIRQLKKT